MAQVLPLVVQKGKAHKADHVKKGTSDKNTKTGKKNRNFAAEMNKADKVHTLSRNRKNKKSRATGLLRLISDVVKKISQKIPPPLQKKLFAFVEDIIKNTRFSDKEKSALLTGLLKKIEKQNSLDATLIDDVQALLTSLPTREQDSIKENNSVQSLPDRWEDAGNISKEKQKTREAPKLVVIDLRKADQSTKTEGKLLSVHEGQSAEELGSDVKPIKIQDGTGTDISYFSLNDDDPGNRQSPNAGMIRKTARGFDQEMLQKLKNSVDIEMVKQTKLIIKQGGNGEIRIVLKPESLGQIRMRLYLNNNHIDGRIFVENNNIRGVVEQSLESLHAALKQEGYDSVSLHVSVGHGSGGEQQGKSHDYIPYVEAVEEFEKNGDMVIEPEMHYSRVNLFI